MGMNTMAPMGITPTGYFTAPWWYYALIVAFIIFMLYILAPEAEGGTKKSAASKLGFTSRRRYYSEY